MLYFHAERLVFLEVPKTGSSALAAALAPMASVNVARPPHLRHMNAPTFLRKTAPWLQSLGEGELESFAVMREPAERLASWYRYLRRPDDAGKRMDASGLSFAGFVDRVLADDPAFRAVGRQDHFLMGSGERPLVTHLFRFDDSLLLGAFLKARFRREVKLARVNVSPAIEVDITPEIRARIAAARPREAALWQALSQQGYLGPG